VPTASSAWADAVADTLYPAVVVPQFSSVLTVKVIAASHSSFAGGQYETVFSDI